MFQEFTCTWSLISFVVGSFLQELDSFFTKFTHEFLWNLEALRLYMLTQLVDRIDRAKGALTHEQFVGYYPNTPDVDFVRVA